MQSPQPYRKLTPVLTLPPSAQVLLDELVVPHNPITDYNTRYSGITAAMLAGVATRLEDVRERFLNLVSAETLLVGHGLENDLHALHVVHAKVIDTSVLYPHPRVQTPAAPPYTLFSALFSAVISAGFAPSQRP